MEPVVVTVAAPPSNRRENFASNQALGLNIVQLIMGAVFLGYDIFVIWFGFWIYGYIFIRFSAVWVGVLVIIAGGIGIGAAKQKTTCLIQASMVLSILSSLAALAVIANAAILLPAWIAVSNRALWGQQMVGVNAAVLACGIVEVVVAIWNSVLCCAVTCCATQQQPPTAYYNAGM